MISPETGLKARPHAAMPGRDGPPMIRSMRGAVHGSAAPAGARPATRVAATRVAQATVRIVFIGGTGAAGTTGGILILSWSHPFRPRPKVGGPGSSPPIAPHHLELGASVGVVRVDRLFATGPLE